MHARSPFEALRQDLTHAVRLLFREKSFTAAAVLSLMLGIGANTAIFQLLDAVRLRTLPVDRPESLADVRIGGCASRTDDHRDRDCDPGGHRPGGRIRAGAPRVAAGPERGARRRVMYRA